MNQNKVLLARQPIYDSSLNVFAYELLHRSSDPENSVIRDGDEASSQVVLDAFGDIGLESITNGQPAFINFTRHLIINPPPLEPDSLIVEVLEDVKPTPSIIVGLQRLKALGFRIALDDFEYREELVPLLELADIIKLDVIALGRSGMREQIDCLKRYDVRLLAEKIEDWETFNFCNDVGCVYFQGYFLARPQPVRGRRTMVGGQAMPRLMRELSDPRAHAAGIAESVSLDPLLSYQLIRLVNSALYRPTLPIESIHDAIIYLGVERIRGWLMILALSKNQDKPRELIHCALIRAKMCESLALTAGLDAPARSFTVGILSTVDAFTDSTMEEALQGMSISIELKAALLERSGPLGVLLDTVLAFERADIDRAPWRSLAGLGCDPKTVEKAYIDSLSWSYSTLQTLLK